jgi:hypothetical protein
MCLSHFRRSNCKHVGMTQTYRWRRVEYSLIFYANLLQLAFLSVCNGKVDRDFELNFKAD